MANPIIMPKQGQSVESCILTEWFIEKGNPVKKGDILFAYETDKASFEEECQFDGILLDTFFEEGDEVPVLTNIAVIGTKGESTDEYSPNNNSTTEDKQTEITNNIEEEKPTISSNEPVIPNGENSELKISPRAKNLAQSKGLNYNQLTGSGPDGRIIECDIESALKNMPKISPLAKKAAKEEGKAYAETGSGLNNTITYNDLQQPKNTIYSNDFKEEPISNIRKLIANSMHASLQNSAQLTHHLSADARKLLAARKLIKSKIDNDNFAHNITLNDLICHAVIKVLKRRPDANAHFLGDKIRKFDKVHLGLAVDTKRGLMVPALKNADDLSLTGLSDQLKNIAQNCKDGKINPDLLVSTAGSFTISNLGNYGVEMFTPILNLPQVCILGVNTIIQRPAPLENGAFGFVPHIGLSLTYDHRAIDGGPATTLLAEIKNEIENLDIQL